MKSLPVSVRRLPHAADLALPARQSAHAAGVDLLAAVDAPVEISPGAFARIPTGVAIALPEGHEAQVRPRSGLSAKHGLFLLNSPGTIDEDYRGEIAVLVANFGSTPFRVERGLRIAQLVVSPVARVEWREVPELPPTDRGAGGFGSTGA